MFTRPDVLPGTRAAACFNQFKRQPPLIHCLTNEVVQELTANVLLALGASPAMVVEPEEAAQFSRMADALLINIGTLHASRAESMLAAIEAANRAEKPWLLDPVAVGDWNIALPSPAVCSPCGQRRSVATRRKSLH